jgi:phosphatidylcholine synthase
MLVSPPGFWRLFGAWSVHLLTASGAFLGFLALLATEDRSWRAAFAWLLLSLIVDGADGWLARRVRIKEVLPGFDGHLVDYVVDYLTYVVVPALIAYRAGLFPPGLALTVTAFILIVATYTYGNLEAKTDDGYFVCFPGLWNVVVFFLFAFGLAPAANVVLVAVFGVLSFVPVHFVHPFRVADRPGLARISGLLLAAVSAALLWRMPAPGPLLVALAGIALLNYLGLGLLRTLRSGSREATGDMPRGTS